MTTKTSFGQDDVAISNKLPTSLDPEGDIGTLGLADIIDTEILRSMMEDFYQLTGMLGAVLDISGKILVAVGWQDICTKFHRCHPDTLRNCHESDTILTNGVPAGTFKAYHCKNNMWDMVTPLIVGDRHVGNVFIGQFFYEDETPDRAFFREQARRYGFDEAEYMAALDRVPRFSREAANAGMQFYAKLAGLVSTLSFNAIQQSRMLAERKRVEDVLRASEDRYRRAQAVSHVGSWEYDLKTTQFSASDETRRIFGFDPDGPDFSTDEIESCIPERERIHQALVDLIESNIPYNLEFEIYPGDGAKPRMLVSMAELKRDERGAPQKVLGVIQDITERKQMEKALRESETRLRLIVNQSPLGICVNDLNGRYVSTNPAYEALTGYTEQELLNLTFFDLTHPDDRPANHRLFDGLSAEDSHNFTLEKRYIRKDGAEINVIVHGEAIRDATGMPQFGLALIEDITERKRSEEKVLQLLAEETESRRTLLSVVEDQQRAEEKIRKLNEELEQRVLVRTEQLEAANKELEAFSYSVSHDLRAPLRAVDGYTRMLSEDYGSVLDKEGQRICSVISSSAQDMGHLIDDLLAFSRFGRAAINPSVIDMEGMARAIFFELTTSEKRKRVKLILQPLPAVAGDPTLIRQVWVNLLSNALKFSANREHPVIEVSAVPQGDEIIYCVRDNGAGFDMRYVNKLFGVFQRLHTVKEFAGTGVGLAIVQRIVARHGGRVWAEGKVDHEASFYFALKGGDEKWIIKTS